MSNHFDQEGAKVGITLLRHRHNIEGAEGPENCAACEIARLRARIEELEGIRLSTEPGWHQDLRLENRSLRAEVERLDTDLTHARTLLSQTEHERDEALAQVEKLLEILTDLPAGRHYQDFIQRARRLIHGT